MLLPKNFAVTFFNHNPPNLSVGPDGSLKFNKMSDEDKKRFIAAVTGSGGKIDSKVSITLSLSFLDPGF